MKNKTKTELSKMTKKNLLLHIEKMQLMIKNDHLETQKENREMQEILAKYKQGTPENKVATIQKAAGQLRYNIFNTDFDSPEDKEKVIKMVDNFISTVL